MRLFSNSLDAVSERDFVLDLLYACAVLGVHLSRLGEEWVLWTSPEFGFVTLDDAYSSGSSIMPQKKNPDAYELMRGKAGRLIGDLNAQLVTRSEEHTSELQSRQYLVCRLLLENKTARKRSACAQHCC